MTVTKINHVSVCVRNIEEAVARYKKMLGIDESYDWGFVPSEGVKAAGIYLGDFLLEFVQPVGTNTFSRFLDKHGEGLHHLSFTVEDVESEQKRLLAEGFELVRNDLTSFKNSEPEQYKGGEIQANYFFVHPRSANGVVVEFNTANFSEFKTG